MLTASINYISNLYHFRVPETYYPAVPSEDCSSHDAEDENTTSSSLLKQTVPEEEDALQQHSETDESDSEEFQPRIVQVTNFQQLPPEDRPKVPRGSPLKSGKIIKHERKSETDPTDGEHEKHNETGDEEDEEDYDVSSEEDNDNVQSLLKSCKPSLFTKQPRRQWPWLVEGHTPTEEEDTTELVHASADSSMQGE